MLFNPMTPLILTDGQVTVTACVNILAIARSTNLMQIAFPTIDISSLLAPMIVAFMIFSQFLPYFPYKAMPFCY
jgi:hypothetical protein